MPAAAVIHGTGRAELNAEASALLRLVGRAPQLTMEVSGLGLYLRRGGTAVYAVPTSAKGTTPCKRLKGKMMYSVDLSSVLETLKVPWDIDFSFVCPVSRQTHPQLGEILVIHIEEELRNLYIRRRPPGSVQRWFTRKA